MSRRIIIGIVATAVPLLTVLWVLAPRSAERVGNLPESNQDRNGYVLKALAQMVADDINLGRRNSLGHLEVFVGHRLWDRRFPVAYAEEKLVSQGAAIVEPLLDILNDRDKSVTLRSAAARLLAFFDDPRILDAYADSSLPDYELALPLMRYLPMSLSTSAGPAQDLLEWLERQRGKTIQELRMSLLDSVMDPKHPDNLESDDFLSIRWLNNGHGQDLDTLIETSSPRALQFRNRELKKGYDPLIAFEKLRPWPNSSAMSDGIKSIFDSEEDQSACNELLDCVYNLAPNRICPPQSWGTTLRSWYWENRDSLQYDSQKRRYCVVITSKAEGEGR